jgi:hypothetical protein
MEYWAIVQKLHNTIAEDYRLSIRSPLTIMMGSPFSEQYYTQEVHGFHRSKGETSCRDRS